MSRRKGSRFERAVSHAVALIWPETKRGLGQARSGGEVPDVNAPGLWIECKRAIRTNPRAALAQAIEASKLSGRTPIAVCRDNRERAFVVLRFEDFLRLLARAERVGLEVDPFASALEDVNADH
jgi:hypothetical protein